MERDQIRLTSVETHCWFLCGPDHGINILIPEPTFPFHLSESSCCISEMVYFVMLQATRKISFENHNVNAHQKLELTIKARIRDSKNISAEKKLPSLRIEHGASCVLL